MPDDFKTLLKRLRIHAKFGLRQFAELIGDNPSNYAGVESGARPPWRSMEKLRRVADTLAIEEGSREWDAFFIAARQDYGGLPPDMNHILERPMIPVLLRTVDELKLTDAQLRALVEALQKKHRRSDGTSKRSS